MNYILVNICLVSLGQGKIEVAASIDRETVWAFVESTANSRIAMIDRPLDIKPGLTRSGNAGVFRRPIFQ
jgi:hypothetical protein